MRGTLGVRRKYRIRRFLGSGVSFVVVLLLLIVFVQAAVGMYAKAREAKEKRDLSISELKRLQARETDLQTEISRLSSERGVEEELRGRYFVAKEGERVAVVNITSSESESTSGNPEKKGFWKKFLSAVGFSGE